MASLSTCHLGLWLGWQILLNLVKSCLLHSISSGRSGMGFWVSLVHLLSAFCADISLPGACPFFWALMASLTSASVIWSRSISRPSAASGCLMSGWICTIENLPEMHLPPLYFLFFPINRLWSLPTSLF